MTALARWARASGDRERGAAAVEFALVLPLLLAILFGIVDFGRAYFADLTVTHAAREGARALAVGNDATAAATSAAAALTVGVTPSTCTPGDAGSVTVSHDFTFVTPIGPILGLLGGGGFDESITLESTGTMQCGG